ncbi:DUF4263 domain-containing protein [Pelagicoccus sp. SDUM812005]|uniref:Shedu immune nuclease family protein n=1 Tax=Pelagicoccus sp. SDUM812005 TaxID=3041257 RepID=UPI002810921C|nr:DUF4263 domain-containing protein [Pelagicoccus sp. SDUM812005]MDQ8180996.1 DUF4263 domain-containing protein [Pelagicoccus sp. SDUM812005]
MIRFEQTEDGTGLLLDYMPENQDGSWIRELLAENGEASLSARIFFVTNEQWIEDEDSDRFVFRIGTIANSYFRIDREVLGINFDLAIHTSINLERKIFAAERNIAIFRRFNEFGLSQLTIGGDAEGALPTEVFRLLLRKFPNTYELNSYAKARISSIIRNHLPIENDYKVRYENYLNTKDSYQGSEPQLSYAPYEFQKFADLTEKIETMLENGESYNEARWQDEILQVVLLLFPRYIRAFKEGPVNDSWANTTRRVDFLLVDASGFIDVIEIKKPSDQHSVTPNDYRGNHVPQRELAGTIMQVEKYLYHFNRWGELGERKLNEKYGSKLPQGLEIKIVNPTGLIIMGRDNNLTNDQKNDFEVIRRKYRNVVDIMTYDDLVRRLKVIRDQHRQIQGS